MLAVIPDARCDALTHDDTDALSLIAREGRRRAAVPEPTVTVTRALRSLSLSGSRN